MKANLDYRTVDQIEAEIAAYKLEMDGAESEEVASDAWNEIKELKAALSRNLRHPDDETLIIIGPVCICCRADTAEGSSRMCEECQRRARILLSQGISSRAIACGDSTIMKAVEEIAVVA